MKKLLTFFCVAALLLPVLLTGCGSGGGATVRLNEVTHSVFYAPQYVAMSLGFFADEGLNVELTNGGGADKVMTAVVSGSADIGLAGPESCIYIYNQGKDDHPVIFAQLTKRDGSFLVGRTGGSFSWDGPAGRHGHRRPQGRCAGDDAGVRHEAERRGAAGGRGGGHLRAV